MDSDDEENVQRQYSQMTTFKDKFEVAWDFRARYIDVNRDKINKTVGRSMIWREIGNKEYTTAKNKDYLRKSIEAYTKSIAFAPLGSKELSLAYAKRSAVLFKARLYEDCLLDIERSLKTGYPDKLKTKLFLRQSLCFIALKPSSHIETGISMANAIQSLPNFKKNNSNYNIKDEYSKMINELKEPREIIKFIPEIKNDNAVIVGASDAIELEKTNDNNQHVVATRDIKSGEFIYISEPFAATPSYELRFTNCWHCCRQTWAGIPCDNCSAIIYCSDICKKKAWNSYHNIECLLSEQLWKFDKILPGHLSTVKLFLKTLNLAGGLLELKKKVDNSDSMKNELIFTNGILNVNTIDNFLNLDFFEAISNKCTFEIASFVFFVDTNVDWSTVMLPFSKILKLSCDPNVDWTHVGSNIGYYACKPIKQGQPIVSNRFVTYHTSSKTDRYIVFEKFFGLPESCECTACVENWPTIEDLPSYKYDIADKDQERVKLYDAKIQRVDTAHRPEKS
ncbi:SET and MYND domain-containing protein 4-like [Aphidius gifuensis]|uniref:SET and MYND domain-containing protein 4-like n=1 Tax=Aphidius gifuensis TaxID=684658 RepID=UPI001CDB8781|nr:SET and MYND domain-containing protein 4-like [Aphidius gifuensis]